MEEQWQEGEGAMRKLGTIDRVIRIVAGLVLLSLIFIGPKSWWGIVGVYPLATGIFSY